MRLTPFAVLTLCTCGSELGPDEAWASEDHAAEAILAVLANGPRPCTIEVAPARLQTRVIQAARGRGLAVFAVGTEGYVEPDCHYRFPRVVQSCRPGSYRVRHTLTERGRSVYFSALVWQHASGTWDCDWILPGEGQDYPSCESFHMTY